MVMSHTILYTFKKIVVHFSRVELLLLGLILMAVGLSAVYVAHGDIMYDADIARDFLILQEISEKKIVLLGPRSGAAPGLFHGPLWSYLNYPAFALGQGNPVVVGWFWVLLSAGLAGSCAYIGRRLFGAVPGLLFAAWVAIRMISFTRGAFNPYGALLLVPAFLYLLIRYSESKKLKYLVAHVLLGGLLIQFQVAVGGPLFLLSLIYVVINIARRTFPLKHVLVYLLIVLTLATYIVFDIRHDWLMAKSVLRYLSRSGGYSMITFKQAFWERLRLMGDQGTFFLPQLLASVGRQKIIFLGVALFALLVKCLKKPVHYPLLWFFYIGYYALTLLHRGGMGVYYYFPLFPLAFMLPFTVWEHIPKRLRYAIVIPFLALNLVYEVRLLHHDVQLIGKRQMSWQFHNKIAQDIFDSAQTSKFGLFIYAPDVQGYRSKYPLVYQDRLHEDKAMQLYQKLPETFVLLAGPPEYALPWEHNPENFLNNSVRITNQPDQRWEYGDIYAVNRYQLSQEETEIEFDPHLNNWLHFR